MSLTVQNKLSMHTGHIGRALFPFSEQGKEPEIDVWKRQVAQALEEIRKNKHGSGLIKQIEESKNEVTILKVATADNPYNATWVNGNPEGYVYESLQNEESLARAFKLALQNGCDKEKLHRLAEKYGQSAAWNLKWDPKDPNSKPVTNWQLGQNPGSARFAGPRLK
jgi:hypothetical protein